MYLFFKDLFILELKKGGWGRGRDPPAADSLSNWPQRLKLVQTKDRSQKFHPGLGCGWLGPKCMSQPPLLFQASQQEAGSEEEQLGLKPDSCAMSASQMATLLAMPQHQPWIYLFLMISPVVIVFIYLILSIIFLSTLSFIKGQSYFATGYISNL